MSDNPYTDDEYDDTYKKVHGDEPTRDQYTDDVTDDTFFPSGKGNSLYPSGWGIWPAGDAADATTSDEYDRTDDYDREAESDDGDGWLGEGIAGTLLVVGVVLFLFPEPATSALGIGLIVLGVLAWAAEATT